VQLERVLEPEVMDTKEEACDYDTMDHSTVNRAFVEDFLSLGKIGETVLDLGAGTAQIPIELCRQYEDCRVMAVDLSIEMLELARYNVEVAGLIERIGLDHLDAKQLPFQDDSFHAVISNSIVHHIPNPLDVLKEAVRVTAVGGILFFRDLMRPHHDDQVAFLVETYAGSENSHQKQMFDDSLRAALTLEEMQELAQMMGFDPASVQATSDRHWTWSGIKNSN
jgi:ubiquinone/menaquinone biosynthesis C-methylase UbiE